MRALNKKLQLAVLALIILGTVAACDFGKSTTIVNKTDNLYQKIKYSGKVVFTGDGKSIEYISNDGYLEYEKNGRSFKAEDTGKGKVAYEFNGDSKVTSLSDEQKQFVSEAVKEIMKARGHLRK
ncbi:MAG: hypothetical protein V4520_07675 [Bacteroidota bacterium]